MRLAATRRGNRERYPLLTTLQRTLGEGALPCGDWVRTHPEPEQHASKGSRKPVAWP